MFNDKANVNSYQALANEDGAYTVNLGCSEELPNQIPIENGTGVFSITVRHYGPSERVLKQGYRLAPLLKKYPKHQALSPTPLLVGLSPPSSGRLRRDG